MSNHGRQRLLAVLLGSWLTISSCRGGDRAGTDTIIVRDSGGIEIVEHLEKRPPGLESWSVDSIPFVDVGGVDKGPEYEIYEQPVHFRQLKSGGIVAGSNGTNPELRLFDSTGRFIRKMGRVGDGPGEIRQIHGIVIDAHDTIWAVSPDARRAVPFAKDGGVNRSVIFETQQKPIWRARDGTWIFQQVVFPITPYSEQPTRRDTVRYFAANPDGQVSRVLVALPHNEFIDGQQVAFRWVEAAPTDSFIYAGPIDDTDIHAYDLSGRLVRIIRLAWPKTKITGTIKERFKGFPRYPEHAPQFGAIRTDALGNVWVAGFNFESDTNPISDSWLVFGPDGRLKAIAKVPLSLVEDVVQTGSDLVLTVEADTNELFHGRLYRIRKR